MGIRSKSFFLLDSDPNFPSMSDNTKIILYCTPTVYPISGPPFPSQNQLSALETGLEVIQTQAAGLVASPWFSANLGSGSCKRDLNVTVPDPGVKAPRGPGAGLLPEVGCSGSHSCQCRTQGLRPRGANRAPGRRGGAARGGARGAGRRRGGGTGWRLRLGAPRSPAPRAASARSKRARYNPGSEVQSARARVGERGVSASPPGTPFPASIQPRVAGGAGGGRPMEFT